MSRISLVYVVKLASKLTMNVVDINHIQKCLVMIKIVVFFKRVHNVLRVCLCAWEALFYLPWIVFIFVNEVLTQIKERGSCEIQWMVKRSPTQISQWGKFLFWYGCLMSVFFPILNNFVKAVSLG